MKKTLTILLAVIFVLQLAACSQLNSLRSVELPPLPEVTQRPEAGTLAQSVTETPNLAQEPVSEQPPEEDGAADTRVPVIVNFRRSVTEEFDPAEGATRILRFADTVPHVSMPGREAAADAINEYIALLDETYVTGNDYGDGYSDGYNSYLEQAIDNFTYAHETGAEIPLEFEAERSVSVERADGRILSLLFTEYAYLGGAHGSYVNKAYVFDTETGTQLSLDQVTPDYDAFAAYVTQSMMEQARADEDLSAEIASFIPEEEWETAFGGLLREGSWYLNDEGLVLFSQLYELASYAAGIQSFTMPYEELGELLYEKWRPGPKESEGVPELLDMAQVEEGSSPILDMVQVSENGEQLCLRCAGRLFDVMLSRAGFAEESELYYRGDPLWYCSCLEASGLQIETVLPDAIPDLMLSYLGEDGAAHRALLTRSGENGALLLIEDGVNFSEY